MATGDPCAAAAKPASSVVGGQIIRSAAIGLALAPEMILSSSAFEAVSPFIFQFPATSGRGAFAIFHTSFFDCRRRGSKPAPATLALSGAVAVSVAGHNRPSYDAPLFGYPFQ